MPEQWIEDELREAVRQWIEADGSQNRLAKASGVSQSVVSDFVRGASVRLNVAERLSISIGQPLKLGGRRTKRTTGSE